MRGFFLGCGALGLVLSMPVKAGVNEGFEAWNSGQYEKAVAEWRGPAEAGDARAQFNMGQAYKLGRGVPADKAAAMDWYRRSAEGGYGLAQAVLGLNLFQQGQHQDAMVWLKKAADQGEGRAQYVVATAYFNGDWMPKDWARAYALMVRAKAAGIGAATSSLAQMEQIIPDQQRKAGLAIAREMERTAALDSRDEDGQAPVVTERGTRPAAPAAPMVSAATPPRPVIKPAMSVRTALPLAPTAPKPTGAMAAGWKVQLGAFSTPDAAHAGWTKLSARSPTLKALAPSYIAAGTYTRLQAGPFVSRAAANDACTALKALASGCFPVAP